MSTLARGGRESETESITEAIVRAIASEAGREPTEISPIGAHIDVDAVERLIAGPGEITLRFVHDGMETTVHGDGRIVVDGTAYRPVV
jgi:hypothetical protein